MLAVIGNYHINLDRINFAEQDPRGIAISIGAGSIHISKEEPEYGAFLATLAAYAKGDK